MAKRIDEEKIIEINEVYLRTKVKSQTAKIVGVSPSTVTKYLIDGYVSQKDSKPLFDNTEIVCAGPQTFIANIDSQHEETFVKKFCKACELTEEEWSELHTLQKGIMI